MAFYESFNTLSKPVGIHRVKNISAAEELPGFHHYTVEVNINKHI
jgi:hypothetical protein